MSNPRARGLFGGFNPLRFGGQPNDTLQNIGALLLNAQNGNAEATTSVAQSRLARQQRADSLAARESLNASLFGGRQQEAPLDLAALSRGNLGPTDSQQPPQPRQSLPSLRDAAPSLIAAQQAGIDIGDYVTLLDRAGPDIRYERGFQYDSRDPNSAPRYAPTLGEGQVPEVAGGRVQSVQNLPGYGESRAIVERGLYDARNASEASYAGAISEATAAGTGRGGAPYQIERVLGPNGETITTNRAALLAGGAIYGQTDAGRAQAITQANAQGEAANLSAQRVRQAPERIQRYEEALSLIPSAITGYAAEQRLGLARAAAALGNEDARNAVAATEIYQNLINRDIGAIVKDMVGSANISNSDRELATSIAGGNTNITPQALTRVVQYELDRQRGYLAQGGQPQGQQGGGTDRAAIEAEARRRGLIR